MCAAKNARRIPHKRRTQNKGNRIEARRAKEFAFVFMCACAMRARCVCVCVCGVGTRARGGATLANASTSKSLIAEEREREKKRSVGLGDPTKQEGKGSSSNSWFEFASFCVQRIFFLVDARARGRARSTHNTKESRSREELVRPRAGDDVVQRADRAEHAHDAAADDDFFCCCWF